MDNVPTTWLVGATFGEKSEDRSAEMVAAGGVVSQVPSGG